VTAKDSWFEVIPNHTVWFFTQLCHPDDTNPVLISLLDGSMLVGFYNEEAGDWEIPNGTTTHTPMSDTWVRAWCSLPDVPREKC